MVGDTERCIMNQQEELEITIEQARETVALRDALRRLHSNRDFKKVIKEGYFVNDASRVVLLKADPEMESSNSQASIERAIIGIGQLGQYFAKTEALGNMAERAITDNQETLEEIAAEELG